MSLDVSQWLEWLEGKHPPSPSPTQLRLPAITQRHRCSLKHQQTLPSKQAKHPGLTFSYLLNGCRGGGRVLILPQMAAGYAA